jgi:hypothetical protein
MSKARAATLLGGLTMVGILGLSSLVGANDPRSYFHSLKGALGRGCLQQATLNVADEDQDIFVAACSFVFSTLRELSPGEGEPEIRQALLDAFAAETPGVSTRSSCTQCVEGIQDLESYLASNGTAASIQDALALGCRKRFKDAPLTECLQNVAAASVPQLIDFALANYPPATACTTLQLCP